jgi:hypothetical protein
MPDLKDKIIGIQAKNFESKWYVPGKELNDLLSKIVVEEAVARYVLEAYRRTEAVQIILKGARKVFAVLILMGKESSILNFIEHDHLQDQVLDAKLPFQKPQLSEILDEHSAEEFYRTQWIVAVPLFRDDLSHRVLDDDAILPFAKNAKIGCGAFGTVFEVYLNAKHQDVWKDSQEVLLRLIQYPFI